MFKKGDKVLCIIKPSLAQYQCELGGVYTVKGLYNGGSNIVLEEIEQVGANFQEHMFEIHKMIYLGGE